MKKILTALIGDALQKMGLNAEDKIQIDVIKDRQHGDFASNIALLLAKASGRKPKDLAIDIISHIPKHPALKHIQAAGAGFINFVVHPQAFGELITEILIQKSGYGIFQKPLSGQSKRIHIEFVSSNPTGPLHVGHGRGAAYGAVLSNLLKAVGHQVHREYYVNDAGRQMDILAVSIICRYLELSGQKILFPSNAYQGDYVIDIAKYVLENKKLDITLDANLLFKDFPTITDDEAAVEIYMDKLIANGKAVLGEKKYGIFFNTGLEFILEDIKNDLLEFGVEYDAWYSEREMWEKGSVERALKHLREKEIIYDKDGAVWFRSTQFGDDKDRVVIRENGQYTYFASDIAYHDWKCANYDEVINVLGADHHGYIPRLKAIIQALGYPVEKFHAPLVQFAVLYRGKERVSMSTRSGSFVTLRELRTEVGKDAARFFYIMRKADQHLDFDLELAKSKSNENPVYYIQYAHARICSIFRQCSEKKLHWEADLGLNGLDLLESENEKNLLLVLSRYQETLLLAAEQYEPHLVAYYLKELSEHFHSYYNSVQFLVSDDKLRHARLCLCAAISQVIANGLALLGVSAPQTM